MSNEEVYDSRADTLAPIQRVRNRIVVFAHGSGSSRHSVRNRAVARRLRQAGFATLLFDLLTETAGADAAAGLSPAGAADSVPLLHAATTRAATPSSALSRRIRLLGLSMQFSFPDRRPVSDCPLLRKAGLS